MSLASLLAPPPMATKTVSVSVAYPSINDTYEEPAFSGIVVGINHPRLSFWVRVAQIKRPNSGKQIGQVVRRSFPVISE